MAEIPYSSLPLSSPWRGERVVLVRDTDAIRLCREGDYEPLPGTNPWLALSRRVRTAAAREFAERLRISPVRLSDLDDAGVLALLGTWVRTGKLVVLREDPTGAAGGDDEDRARRKLVREIDAKATRGLAHQGRQYRLVVDNQLDRLSDRQSYEVVSQRDAAAILGVLAGPNGASGADLSKLLTEAATMLSQDWRPPARPDGLVLLRRIRTVHAIRPDDGPALTPSQLKKMAQTDWIEIELVDQDGEPVTMPYHIELTDKSVRKGQFDVEGFAGLYEIESGTCKLTIGEVIEAAASPDNDTIPDDTVDATGDEDTDERSSSGSLPEESSMDELEEEADFAEDVPETKPIYLRLHMDPDKVAALKEQFRLFSADGSYSKTEATDRIKGNAYMDLMFEDAPTDLAYSLEISGPGIEPYLVFENVPFAKLNGYH